MLNRIVRKTYSDEYESTSPQNMTDDTQITIKGEQKKVIFIELVKVGEGRAKYYRGVHIYFFIFSFDSKNSLEFLRPYREEISKFCFEDSIFYLVGNKADVEKQITTQEAKAFAKEIDITRYREISCKNNTEIDALWEESKQLFETITNQNE